MGHRHRGLIGALVVVALAALALIAPGEDDAIALGGIIYVDAGATGDNNGTSWTDAFTDLQEALGVADMGAQIWVVAGTYKPTSGTDRTVSFQMKNGVEIYGGFAGGEGSLGDRNWETNETILSGDIGTVDDNSDNSYHVFYHPSGLGLDDSAVLDGFTITGGNADGAQIHGGGMYNYGSSPTLTNCAFNGNSAESSGGGMFNDYSSSPTLTNCTFSSNLALSGGGMANAASSPTLTNCTFFGNSSEWGGGMLNDNSSPTLTNCTFSGNSAGWGGGMFNWSSSPMLTNCAFSGNSAPNGAAMYNSGGSTPTVTNSILWGDSPGEIANSDLFLSPLVTYSNVQGGYPGEGNIFVSPLFVDATGGDFHLATGSPCIDAGTNGAPDLPPYDFEGDDRVLDGDGDGDAIVDMGVDEVVYVPPPPVIFVDEEATGANNGTSWADAFTTLQPALAWAVDGVEIWVAEGVYKPTSGTDRTASFQMKNGVAIYGGFDPSDGVTEFEQRNWLSHEPILSGDIGIEGDDSDNSYHVFYHPAGTNLDSSAILDGFSIRSGNANGASPNNSGAGMYNDGSSPALTRCAFFDNSAASNGGGMYNDGSSPTMTYCTFWGNSVDIGHGGGMYNTNSSSPMLADCTFTLNSSVGNFGGGMANSSSSPILVNCAFVDNWCFGDGGGIANFSSSPVLTDCTFSGNSAAFYSGGGMYNRDSSPTLTNCTFEGNWIQAEDGKGGGMYNIYSSPTLANCTFRDNAADSGGGMYNNNNSSPVLTGCTFEGNFALVSGGGMYNRNSSPTVTNSILWQNSPNQIANDASSPVVTYCDVMGDLYPGTGNINADPLFVDAANGDYHLGPDSPCIDVGSNDAPYLPLDDFEGDDRVLDGDGDGSAIVDMGVDEVVYAGPPVVIVEIDVRPGSDQNPINLGAGGVLPVAILTTEEFDASTVKPASVRFAGAAPKRWTREDVDRDGDEDLLLNFKIQELTELEGPGAGSVEVTLTGETFPWAGGLLIEGTDTVKIIP